jgi:hypothetical protein
MHVFTAGARFHGSENVHEVMMLWRPYHGRGFGMLEVPLRDHHGLYRCMSWPDERNLRSGT